MSDPGPAAPQGQLVKAVVASTVGTAIEWYDFFLYGVAAALVFPQLFFPTSDPYTGTLLAFSTYFVGFAARPIGAAIFGHYGDRIGRKATLVATLLLMGVATMAIGLAPTYAQVGPFGGILLVILRGVQGIGVGGEWGGSVLLAIEWGGRGRRGLIGSWPQFGVPVGLLLAYGAIAAMNRLAPDAFLSWGWRVPFLASGALIVVGLWIRLGILETPVFARLAKERKVARYPVAEVLKNHGREVALTALIRTGQQSAFYIFTVYVLDYGTKALGFTRGEILRDVLIAASISLVTIPLFGHLSDVLGRRRTYLLGSAVLGAFAFPYFWLLDSGTPLLVGLGIALSVPLHDLMYAPLAAFTAESFPPHVRYSGASLGYQLASITAGGPAPLIALWLYKHYGTSSAIALYIVLAAAISFVTAWMLRPDNTD